MRLSSKSFSKLTLNNLLKRRKSNLKQFLTESGIVSYETLVTRCNSLGVSPPSSEEFNEIVGNNGVPSLSSPTEGVVVLPPVDSNISSQKAEVTDEKEHVKVKRKKNAFSYLTESAAQEDSTSKSED